MAYRSASSGGSGPCASLSARSSPLTGSSPVKPTSPWPSSVTIHPLGGIPRGKRASFGGVNQILLSRCAQSHAAGAHSAIGADMAAREQEEIRRAKQLGAARQSRTAGRRRTSLFQLIFFQNRVILDRRHRALSGQNEERSAGQVAHPLSRSEERRVG